MCLASRFGQSRTGQSRSNKDGQSRFGQSGHRCWSSSPDEDGRGSLPHTLIASKGSPLRSVDRHTSLSLVFGQVFTDSTLESWSLGGISDDFQNEHTQSFPTLVLAFAVPRTFDWWSPTWVPRTLVSSVWLEAKLADMCAVRGADSGASIRGPVERGTHSSGCGSMPMTPNWVPGTSLVRQELNLRSLGCPLPEWLPHTKICTRRNSNFNQGCED